jgi:hypothetical protein
MAGELLPLFHEGQEYAVFNVTDCVNALDQERTEWHISKSTGTKSRTMIAAYAFKKDRLHRSSIFKIPERFVDILTWERDQDPEWEFKAAVEQFGLTGITFEEIWDEDSKALIRQKLFGKSL